MYLEKRDPTKNMRRFYRVEVVPTLFGQYAVVRHWGRIGSKGSRLEEWFDLREDALEKMDKLGLAKQKRGYASVWR